ncbi:MAG: hypothetical protein DMG62_20860 [Acidobacteria bacterium]|nr:MAG: hypothetical protein DMG62_20860 [Acidobacteriota bacterium]
MPQKKIRKSFVADFEEEEVSPSVCGSVFLALLPFSKYDAKMRHRVAAKIRCTSTFAVANGWVFMTPQQTVLTSKCSSRLPLSQFFPPSAYPSEFLILANRRYSCGFQNQKILHGEISCPFPEAGNRASSKGCV